MQRFESFIANKIIFLHPCKKMQKGCIFCIHAKSCKKETYFASMHAKWCKKDAFFASMQNKKNDTFFASMRNDAQMMHVCIHAKWCKIGCIFVSTRKTPPFHIFFIFVLCTIKILKGNYKKYPFLFQGADQV